jgi:hypothetical protein
MRTTDTATRPGQKGFSLFVGGGVDRTMGNRLVLAGACLLAASCHRSGLSFSTPAADAAAQATAADAPPSPVVPDVAPPMPDLLPPIPDSQPAFDLAPVLVPDATVVMPPPEPLPPPTPGCQPQPETCNGKDDDCDGKIDEDLPPIPCPNGGNRYCVAGRTSECPRLCEQCRPGSQRVCFISYCTYWGTQSCAADGRSFGLCRERQVPSECESIAKSKKKSPELERCCIDNGYCCVDEQDLDGDQNRTEMLGRCGAVTCDP